MNMTILKAQRDTRVKFTFTLKKLNIETKFFSLVEHILLSKYKDLQENLLLVLS